MIEFNKDAVSKDARQAGVLMVAAGFIGFFINDSGAVPAGELGLIVFALLVWVFGVIRRKSPDKPSGNS